MHAYVQHVHVHAHVHVHNVCTHGHVKKLYMLQVVHLYALYYSLRLKSGMVSEDADVVHDAGLLRSKMLQT